MRALGALTGKMDKTKFGYCLKYTSYVKRHHRYYSQMLFLNVFHSAFKILRHKNRVSMEKIESGNEETVLPEVVYPCLSVSDCQKFPIRRVIEQGRIHVHKMRSRSY